MKRNQVLTIVLGVLLAVGLLVVTQMLFVQPPELSARPLRDPPTEPPPPPTEPPPLPTDTGRDYLLYVVDDARMCDESQYLKYDSDWRYDYVEESDDMGGSSCWECDLPSSTLSGANCVEVPMTLCRNYYNDWDHVLWHFEGDFEWYTTTTSLVSEEIDEQNFTYDDDDDSEWWPDNDWAELIYEKMLEGPSANKYNLYLGGSDQLWITISIPNPPGEYFDMHSMHIRFVHEY